MTAKPAALSECRARFEAVLGPKHVVTGADTEPFLTDPRDLYTGAAAAVLRPGSVAEVSEILKIANETRSAIVPQGGNTGLVGAQTPDCSGTQFVLSLSRLNELRKLDAANNAIAVDAGMILADIQKAAEDADRLFPLSLGAEGSCQIGGNLSSNAGGINVLAYGTARELVLGLEVVLADGRILDAMKGLRKDNTGYDLKQMFLGAEGTLGVITGAVLKLYPRPRDAQHFFAGLNTPDDAIKLLRLVQAKSANQVTSFELISRVALDLVLGGITDTRDPLDSAHDWYVLATLSGGNAPGALKPVVEDILSEAFTRELIEDAALAQNHAQARSFWRLRETVPEAQKFAGGSIKHDVSVPVSDIPGFLDKAGKAVEKTIPGARPVPFGHIGDGNIHYNVSQPEGMDKQAFLDQWDAMSEAVHEVVVSYNGSISAEHGIGRMKRDAMATIKSDAELDIMRGLKALLDPNGILNPGKLLPPAG